VRYDILSGSAVESEEAMKVSRRSLLGLGIQASLVLLYGSSLELGVSNSSEIYVTSFWLKLNFDSLSGQDLVDFKNGLLVGSVGPSALLPKVNFELWQNSYNQTKLKYITEGRLMGSWRIYEKLDSSITLLNVWKNKQDFERFQVEAQTARLPLEFGRLGMRSKLDTNLTASDLGRLINNSRLKAGTYVFNEIPKIRNIKLSDG
jgi:hypothetical protein